MSSFEILLNGLSTKDAFEATMDAVYAAAVEEAAASGISPDVIVAASDSFRSALVEALADGLPPAAALEQAKSVFIEAQAASRMDDPDQDQSWLTEISRESGFGSLIDNLADTDLTRLQEDGFDLADTAAEVFMSVLRDGLRDGMPLEMALAEAREAAIGNMFAEMETAAGGDPALEALATGAGIDGLVGESETFKQALAEALDQGVDIGEALAAARAAEAELALAETQSTLEQNEAEAMIAALASGEQVDTALGAVAPSSVGKQGQAFLEALGDALAGGRGTESLAEAGETIDTLARAGAETRLPSGADDLLVALATGGNVSEKVAELGGDSSAFEEALSEALTGGASLGDAVSGALDTARNVAQAESEVDQGGNEVLTALATGDAGALDGDSTFTETLSDELQGGTPPEDAVQAADAAAETVADALAGNPPPTEVADAGDLGDPAEDLADFDTAAGPEDTGLPEPGPEDGPEPEPEPIVEAEPEGPELPPGAGDDEPSPEDLADLETAAGGEPEGPGATGGGTGWSGPNFGNPSSGGSGGGATGGSGGDGFGSGGGGSGGGGGGPGGGGAGPGDDDPPPTDPGPGTGDPVNSPPSVAGPVTANQVEDSGILPVNLLAGASDPDGPIPTVGGLALVAGDASGVTVGVDSLTVDTSAYGYLAVGETEVIVYNYTLSDGNGGSVPQTATITITGTNDSPTIGVVTDVSEALVEADAGLSTSGSFEVTDVDRSDVVSITGVAVAVSGDVTGAPSEDTLKAMFTPSAGIEIDGTTDKGTVSWSFDSGAEAFDFLADGESLELAYKVTLSDDNSPPAEVAQTVTITVKGTNDGPQIGAVTAVETLTETDTSLATSGSFEVIDADLSDVVKVIDVSVATSGDTSGVPDSTALLAMFKTASDLVIGEAATAGSVDWSFDSGKEFFDYLAGGESLQVTYTVTVADDNDPPVKVPQDVTITVTGSNDGPEIGVVTDVSETLAETDAGVSTSGSFQVTDADTSNVISITGVSVATSGGDANAPGESALLAMFAPVSGVEVDGTSTAGTVAWTFDSGVEAFDYLAEGESLQVTYTVTLSDDNVPPETVAQDVTITVAGSNDGPTAVADTGATEERTEIEIDVLANDVDPDTSDSLTLVSVGAPSVTGTDGDPTALGTGTAYIEDGKLVFDPGHDFDALTVGQTATVEIPYTVSDRADGTGVTSAGVATVTLDGATNPPEAEDDSHMATTGMLGLAGEFYVVSESLSVVADAEAAISGDTPLATFVSTAVNYEVIGSTTLNSFQELETWLGSGAVHLEANAVAVPDNGDGVVRLNGSVYLAAGTTYTFRSTSDDGSVVRIDGNLVVDNDGAHPEVTVTGAPFAITESGFYDIEIVMFDVTGHFGLAVEYMTDSDPAWRVVSSEITVTDSAADLALTTLASKPLTIQVNSLLANDTDSDSAVLTLNDVDPTAYAVDSDGNLTDTAAGTVSLPGDGTVVFQPYDGFSGQAAFDYTVADDSGNTDTATVTLQVMGQENFAVDLGGGSTFTVADTDDSLDFADAMTLEAWIRLDADTGADQVLISNLDPSGSGGYELGLDYDSTDGSYSVAFSIDTGGAEPVSILSDSSVVTGAWTHIAGVYDANGAMTLYVDGVAQEGTVAPNADVVASSQPLTLGGRPDGSATYSGALEEVRVWNHARTEDDLQGDMTRQLNGDESGLAGYWTFNGGMGTDVADGSGNGHTATFGGTFGATHSYVNLSNPTVAAGTTYKGLILGTHPDGDSLDYGLGQTGTGSVALTPDGNTFDYTAGTEDDSFVVTVTDENGNQTTETISIDVV